MDLAIQIAGALIVLLVLVDLYMTVLFPRGGPGPVSRLLFKLLWPVFRLPHRLSRRVGEVVLAHAGPLILVVSFFMWGLLMVLGFGFIVWPELGTGVMAAGEKPTPTDFYTALYYAGFNLTTLGIGDLTPVTPFFRILAFIKAGLGFSLITLVLAYIISIYGALHQRTALGLSMHHRTCDTGAAAVYLACLVRGPARVAMLQDLTRLADRLTEYDESHHFYPVMHFFRLQDPRYAMARIVFLALDTASIVRAALDQEEYAWLIDSLAVEQLWQSGIHITDNLASGFMPQHFDSGPRDPDKETVDNWQAHLDGAVTVLKEHGIGCRSDAGDALQRYIVLRKRWDNGVKAFTKFMYYEWREITADACSSRRR